jgi:hypothetical protein
MIIRRSPATQLHSPKQQNIKHKFRLSLSRFIIASTPANVGPAYHISVALRIRDWP